MNNEEQETQEEFLPIDQVINLPKIKQLVPAIREQLLEGNYDILKAFIFFKKVGKIAESIFDVSKIKDKNEKEQAVKLKDAIEESIRSNQGKDSKTAKLYNVEIRESQRGYWTYNECNDPIWDELDKIQKEVDALKKVREKELQLQIQSPGSNPLGFGIKECKIAVPYFPVFTTEENTDLAIINPPYKGAKSIFAFYM